MASKTQTVAAYLKALPADQRRAIDVVRKVIRKNLDKGYQECMQYGMIAWSVPHSIYPSGYRGDPKQPRPFAYLASRKNHMSVSLLSLYNNPAAEKQFRAAWEKEVKAGRARKLDIGKACIRFKSVEDLALDVIGETIRGMQVKKFIALYESSRK